MTHLTLTLSSCVLVQPALCCPGPLPSQRGLLTYEGTANLTQGAPCPVHSYFCRCSAQIPLLPPQLQPSSWSIPSPRTLGHYPLPLYNPHSSQNNRLKHKFYNVTLLLKTLIVSQCSYNKIQPPYTPTFKAFTNQPRIPYTWTP